jgi:hypothetical protein
MTTRTNPRVYFVAREQMFRFDVSGLLPQTTHYFYFERQLVSASKLRPLGGKPGDPLVTDSSGKMTFDYMYDSGLTGDKTTLEQSQAASNLIAGNKEVALTTTNSQTLAADFMTTSLSCYRSHIRIQVLYPPESEYVAVSDSTAPANVPVFGADTGAFGNVFDGP